MRETKLDFPDFFRELQLLGGKTSLHYVAELFVHFSEINFSRWIVNGSLIAFQLGVLSVCFVFVADHLLEVRSESYNT